MQVHTSSARYGHAARLAAGKGQQASHGAGAAQDGGQGSDSEYDLVVLLSTDATIKSVPISRRAAWRENDGSERDR